MAPKRVLIGKVDLDTVGAGFLRGVSREDAVEVVRSGRASDEDLADPEVICIEVGGSGQTDLNNWDHHDPKGPEISTTFQAFLSVCGGLIAQAAAESDSSPSCIVGAHCLSGGCWACHAEWPAEVRKAEELSGYINTLDTIGPKGLPQYGRLEFPGLSDVFAGMLLTTRDPVEQFHRGIEILGRVVSEGQDPFGTIRGFPEYAAAKAENNRQIAKAVAGAKWSETKSGRKLGYLETDFYGAPGALYGLGAEIVVAYAPWFGNPPVPKFTVAGNGVRVDAALVRLNELEPGWGGPATGTIVGSPRGGSRISLEEVVEVVKSTL